MAKAKKTQGGAFASACQTGAGKQPLEKEKGETYLRKKNQRVKVVEVRMEEDLDEEEDDEENIEMQDSEVDLPWKEKEDDERVEVDVRDSSEADDELVEEAVDEVATPTGMYRNVSSE